MPSSAPTFRIRAALFIASLAIGGVAQDAPPPAPAAPALPPTVPLVILHTNDVHGQIRPIRDPRSRDSNPRLVGGYQELVAAIDEERAKVAHSVLVDAGDWFQGTPEGTLSRGRCTIELMNAAGYDFATIGNHDFDLGAEALRDMGRLARFRVFGANLRSDVEVFQEGGEPPEYVAAQAVRAGVTGGAVVDVEGFRVGFDGLTAEETPNIVTKRSFEWFQMGTEVEGARAALERARNPGFANAFVLVNHVGKDRNVLIAREVPGIDVIIGGHAHPQVLEQGVVVPSTGTLIAQAAVLTEALGIVTLDIAPKEKRIVKKSARLRRVYPVEGLRVPRVAPIIERYEKQVEEVMGVQVATAPEGLTKDGNIENGNPLGSWLAEAMLRAAGPDGADVAVHNRSGMRASIAPGPVRVRELFEVSPFGNRLVVLTLTGADVRKIAEMTAETGGMRGSVFAGVEISWKPGPDGKPQVTGLRCKGEPLEGDREVRVVTTDFLAGAVEIMPPFKNAKGRVDLEPTMLDATINVAREQKTLLPPKTNPWVRDASR